MYCIAFILKALSALQMFYQLKVLDSPQQRLTHIFETTLNTLSEEDRSHYRDHYPALFDKCVGSFNSTDRVSGDWALWFNVLIREDAKV